MMKLPHAIDARRHATELNSVRDETRDEGHRATIAKAIEAGKYEAVLALPVTDALRMQLMLGGYKIGQRFKSDYNESSVTVSW